MIINNKINAKEYKKNQKKLERQQRKQQKKVENEQKTKFFSVNNVVHTFIIPGILLVFLAVCTIVVFTIRSAKLKEIQEKELLAQKVCYVYNMNKAINSDLKNKNIEKHDSINVVYSIVGSAGFNIEKVVYKLKYNVAWDSEEDCMVLLDKDKNIVTYAITDSDIEEVEVDMTNNGTYKASRYYTFVNGNDFKNNTPYSVYALEYESIWPTDIEICSNFNIGSVTSIKSILLTDYYNNLTNCKLQIDSFTTTITVDKCPNTKIDHYGSCGAIHINYCKEWNEYGSFIGRIELDFGNLYVKSDSTVYQINRNNTYVTQVVLEQGAIAYGSTGLKLQDCVYSDNDEKYSTVDSYTCKHENYITLNDKYNVCVNCGNTLVTFTDEENQESLNTLFGYNFDDEYEFILPITTVNWENIDTVAEGALPWPYTNTIICEGHQFVLINSIQDENETGYFCDGLVTDYYCCSLCGKIEIVESYGEHLLDDDGNCLREEFGCAYTLEKEGYTNIINVNDEMKNNITILDNKVEVYAAQTVKQEGDDYYLCYTINLDSKTKTVDIYRLAVKENFIFVYYKIVDDSNINAESFKTVKIKNYCSDTNGINGFTIDSNTNVCFVLEQ